MYCVTFNELWAKNLTTRKITNIVHHHLLNNYGHWYFSSYSFWYAVCNLVKQGRQN
jgi:hypothetical protein